MRQINYGPKFEEEIAELEAKLAQKKQEAIQAGENRPEKEMISETLREQVRLAESSSTNENVVATPAATSKTPKTSHQTVQDLDDEGTKQHLEALLTHAFDKGILSAVNEAKKTKNPYLIDKLHDELVDHFYQQLLNSRQIIQE